MRKLIATIAIATAVGAGLASPSRAALPPIEPATPSLCDREDRFAATPCADRKAAPASLDDFLAAPTEAEWQAQLAMGWFGSDGSTAVSDFIGGVEIGRTSREVTDADLPANRHDWYYEMGRTYGLGWKFRRAADQSYRDMCLERVAHLQGLKGLAARANVHGRYLALRVVGIGAWIAKPEAAPEA